MKKEKDNLAKKGKEKAFRALLAMSNALLKIRIDKRKQFFGVSFYSE